MSRVERRENTSDRRGSDQLREIRRDRTANRRSDTPGHTPGQAAGDERDVEEALRRQEE